MLYRKLKDNTKVGHREVIGLIGTHHGVGVTYLALMLAFYLGEEEGRKTALLECNKHQDMQLIQETYHWNKLEKDAFSFHKVTCYKEVTMQELPGILSDNYNCFILDFGEDFASYKDEFMRCTIKFVVAGRSEWDKAKLEKFIREADDLPGSGSWLYFIPQINDITVKKLRKYLNRKVYSVPLMADPILPSKKAYRFFKQILNLH